MVNKLDFLHMVRRERNSEFIFSKTYLMKYTFRAFGQPGFPSLTSEAAQGSECGMERIGGNGESY
jgi:hypothetical protein